MTLKLKSGMWYVRLKSQKDLDSKRFQELEGSLQAHEERMKRKQEESLEQALKVEAFLKNNGPFKS